jgi:hypothetical protein
METLKGLNLLNVGKQPLSTGAYNFYINTFAGGTGANGTYLVTDFVGTAIGVTAGTYFDQATTIITNRASTLSTLSDIYQRMVRSCNGTYGPVPSGPIVIPAGPGAGSYLSPDSAVGVLTSLANTEIGNLVTTLGTDTAALNNAWNNICVRVNYEVNNLSLCNIDLNNLISGDRFSALNLVVSLPEFGNDTTVGGAGQFMESIARTNNLAGQAMIGAMREGRNNTKMNVARITRDNTVPDNSTSTPTQATLSSSSYTVAEARAFVNQINRAL